MSMSVTKAFMIRDDSRSVLYRYWISISLRFLSIKSILIQMHNLPDRASSPEIIGSDLTVIPTRVLGFITGYYLFSIYTYSHPLHCKCIIMRYVDNAYKLTISLVICLKYAIEYSIYRSVSDQFEYLYR